MAAGVVSALDPAAARLLLADDNETQLTLVADSLGSAVDTARTGLEALVEMMMRLVPPA